MNILYRTKTGSHMYGTNLPTSDTDWKTIFLPKLSNLIYGKKIEICSSKTNTVKNQKNTESDIDEEFIPLQIFAKDFVRGQTYALELAFSLESLDNEKVTKIDQLFYEFCKELKAEFLTSDVKSLMGYVYNQANIYSFKGERLNCIREVIQNFELWLKLENSCIGVLIGNKILSHLSQNYPKYFKVTEYIIDNKGTTRPCLEILTKTLPMTLTFEQALIVLRKIEAGYGKRAEAISESAEIVDWKALMHATRIILQAKELFSVGKITLPRPSYEIKQLLAIRKGQVNVEFLKEFLTKTIVEVENLVKISKLSSSNSSEFQQKFELFLTNWLYKFYKLSK